MGDDTAMTVPVLSIGFVSQDDPFYVRIFFEEFLRDCERREIKVVVIAPPMGKKSFAGLLLQMYDFYGGWDFLRMGFRYVLYKAAAKLPGRIRGGRCFSVAQVCRHFDIPVLTARDINDSAFLDQLSRLGLDLIISVAAPQVFRERLIGLPRLGCINIHNSKLPKYRGMLPNFWQMFHGEKSVGTTIHCINAGIDDGEILLQKETPIEAGESLDALIRRTKALGASLMNEMLRHFRAGSVTRIPNRKEDASYFTFPTGRDVGEFRRRGYRLL